jgi:RHS repeat-associated protein
MPQTQSKSARESGIFRGPKYEYDAYGNVIASGGAYATANTFRFSTKYWDDESGLGYWGQRYYDPRFGRWLNRDPIGELGGTALYVYASNAPTLHVDFNGLYSYCDECTCKSWCDAEPGTYGITRCSIVMGDCICICGTNIRSAFGPAAGPITFCVLKHEQAHYDHCKDWRSGGHENDPTAKEFECIASQLDSRDCDCECLKTLWAYINKRQGNCADGDAYWVKRCNDAYDALYKKIYEKRKALHCPPGR